MTPEQCTGLGALLAEARDWVRETDPGNLDAEVLDAAVDAVARIRQTLIRAGAS